MSALALVSWRPVLGAGRLQAGVAAELRAGLDGADAALVRTLVERRGFQGFGCWNVHAHMLYRACPNAYPSRSEMGVRGRLNCSSWTFVQHHMYAT